MLHLGFDCEVQSRFDDRRIHKLQRAGLNDITVTSDEDFPAGQADAAQDCRFRDRAAHLKIGFAVQLELVGGRIQLPRGPNCQVKIQVSNCAFWLGLFGHGNIA